MKTGSSALWAARIDGLLSGIERVFFPSNGILCEPACEKPPSICDTDMLSFKGYVLRWLAATMQLAPFTTDRILPLLKASAQAAVDHCNIGDNGRICTFNWTIESPDWNTGVGQQMNALAALCTLLINEAKPPVTNLTGGTSIGDPNAGSAKTLPLDPIRSRDRIGAALVTILLVGGAVAVFAWISWPEGMFTIS